MSTGSDQGDDHLLSEWGQRLRRTLHGLKSCGPLDATRQLDALFQTARHDPHPSASEALSMALVQVLVGPPAEVSTLLIRAAGTIPIPRAEGPLLAHLYGDQFWPPVTKGQPPSSWTDLQRAAMVTALADLRSTKTWPRIMHWISQVVQPIWSPPHQWWTIWFSRSAPSLDPTPVEVVSDQSPAQAGQTFREWKAYASSLGRLVPRDWQGKLGVLLESLKPPGFPPAEQQAMATSLCVEYLHGILLEQLPEELRQNPTDIAQALPATWGTSSRWMDRLIARAVPQEGRDAHQDA